MDLQPFAGERREVGFWNTSGIGLIKLAEPREVVLADQHSRRETAEGGGWGVGGTIFNGTFSLQE